MLHPQVILIDRVQTPHYYTAPWDDNPMRYIGPILEGGHPEDQMVFAFANSNECVVTRQMLQGLASWVELARFCSATFEGTRPTQIVGRVQVRSRPDPLVTNARPFEALAECI